MAFLPFIIALVVSLFVVAKGSVLGIDYGSEFMKVAVVQPGKPFEIGKLL